jgi:hypothetical protein
LEEAAKNTFKEAAKNTFKEGEVVKTLKAKGLKRSGLCLSRFLAEYSYSQLQNK